MQKHRIVSPLVDYFLRNNMMRPFADMLGYRSKSIILEFTAAGTPYSIAPFKRYNFQPDDSLNGENALITAIEIICADQQIQLGSGKENISSNVLKNGFLNICDKDQNIVSTIPLFNLYAPAYTSSGKTISRKLFMTHWKEQNWQNCFFEFADTTGISTTQGIKFVVYYEPLTNK